VEAKEDELAREEGNKNTQIEKLRMPEEQNRYRHL
jgi:hypothetical protein